MALYLFLDSSSGFSLFHVHGLGEIGHDKDAVVDSVVDFAAFRKLVSLVAIFSFPSSVHALHQCNAIAEGCMTDELRNFLETNLPRVEEGEKPQFCLGVAEPRLGYQITKEFKILCRRNEFVIELLLGVWLHFGSFIDEIKKTESEMAQQMLGHSCNRREVKLGYMIVQGFLRLDTLHKDVETLSKRVREWYSWHFPELVKIVNENYLYAKIAKFLENKSELSEDHIPHLGDILGVKDKAEQIVEAAKASSGVVLSPIDLMKIQKLAQKVVDLCEYKKKLSAYLVTEMNDIAPNLTSLVGEVVAAHLISCAGSLLHLAKCPSSTLQMLGAAKELFRAPRSQEFVFCSSLIGRASGRNKGRLSRYLANKCSMAARIDCFSETNTNLSGEKLRGQVYERLDICEKEDTAHCENADITNAATDNLLNKSPEEADETNTNLSGEKLRQQVDERLDICEKDDIAHCENVDITNAATENLLNKSPKEADDGRKKQLDTKNGSFKAFGKKSKKRKNESFKASEKKSKKIKRGKFRSLKFGWKFQNRARADEFRRDRVFIWEKPRKGWIKINSDGSKEASGAGYGGIIRDEEGNPLLLYSDLCPTMDNIQLIELRGALAGLDHAVTTFGNDIKVWLEIDNGGCVRWILKKLQPWPDAEALLSRIWTLTASLTDFKVSHIWREGNRLADLLAKSSPRMIPQCVLHSPSVSSLHPDLLSIVNAEKCGKVYYRGGESSMGFTFYPLGKQKEKEYKPEEDQEMAAVTETLD